MGGCTENACARRTENPFSALNTRGFVSALRRLAIAVMLAWQRGPDRSNENGFPRKRVRGQILAPALSSSARRVRCRFKSLVFPPGGRSMVARDFNPWFLGSAPLTLSARRADGAHVNPPFPNLLGEVVSRRHRLGRNRVKLYRRAIQGPSRPPFATRGVPTVDFAVQR